MSTPMLKFESVDSMIKVTLVQQNEKDDNTAVIVMDGTQFSNVLYTLKAIEKQLIQDGQQYIVNNNNKEPIGCMVHGIAKNTMSPENVNDIFTFMDGNSHWSLQAITSNEEVLTDNDFGNAMEVCENEDVNKSQTLLYQKKEEDNSLANLLTDDLYDPVNYSMYQYGNTNAEVGATAETLNEGLYTPSIVIKRESCEFKESEEIAMNVPPSPQPPSVPITSSSSTTSIQLPFQYESISTKPLNTLLSPSHSHYPPSALKSIPLKKLEKRSTARSYFLAEYAKLLCKKFLDAFDLRCLDVKNNRSFIRLSTKEQIKSMFDELHTSVTDKEFEEKVGCSMGKDIFVTCLKTRLKLINLITMMVDD